MVFLDGEKVALVEILHRMIDIYQTKVGGEKDNRYKRGCQHCIEDSRYTNTNLRRSTMHQS